MPSMMENIVMKKCKVKFKLARTIVTDARNNMPQENRNCLWSKALEEECLRIYYEQYGVKLGLTRPASDLLGESSHTQDTSLTSFVNPTDSSVLSNRTTANEGEIAKKKSRSIGTKSPCPTEMKSPSRTKGKGDNKCLQLGKSPSKPLSTPSSKVRRTLTEQTSFSESQDLNSSGRSRSLSKRRIKKEKSVDNDQLDHSSHSGHSSRSSSTRSRSKTPKSKKSSSKMPSSILDLEPSNDKYTPRKKSFTKRNSVNEPDASKSLFDVEISSELAESISSPPKYQTSPILKPRLSAGMKGFDAPAARDTTPFKPKVDKSPKKTNRKKSFSMSKVLPEEMLGVGPAIMRALENRNERVNAGQEPSSPSRIFIRCKRSKLKSPEKSFHDDDNQSIGPEDLLKGSPDRKPRGSIVSLNNSRFLDGNSSKTRMVPVVRQSSGGNKSPQRRRGSKLRSSFRKEDDSPHTSPRSRSATETSLFSGGFLVSPSVETNMDNFQNSVLTRQNSAESFLSIESFSGTSDSSPFDSPVQVSLASALPALPTLSPTGQDGGNMAFDSETVSSSLAAPKKPLRRTSQKKSYHPR